MKDKRVDSLIERIAVLERKYEALERSYNGLNKRLKANRCVDKFWDGGPVEWWGTEWWAIDISGLAERLRALVEYLGLEWQVETTKAGFQEKVEETE
jgi:hypothetical protein